MKQLALELPHRPPRKPRRAVLRSFHARLESPAEALAGEARAGRQERRVLAWMRAEPRASRWTPTDVWRALGGDDGFGPKTSVRRALTNLTARGLLVHHREDRRPGPHGARESCWSLAP